jgi:hypothetical protein
LPPAPVPGEPLLGEQLVPLADPQALAESFRHYEGTFLQQERELDAILRFCATREPFDGALASLVDHLREVAASGALISTRGAAASWLTGTPPVLRSDPTIHARRIAAVGVRAARGEAGPLLALPTHEGGWIDPRVLVERVLQAPADEVEFAQALLRLAPDGRDEALPAAAEVPGHVGAALRCALGGEPLTGGGWVPAAARAAAGLTPIDVEVEQWPDAASPGDRLRASVRTPSAPFGSGPLGELLAAVRDDDDWGRYVDPHDFPARRDLAAAAAFKRAGWSLGSDDVASGAVAVLRLLLPEREPIAPLALRLAVLALGSCSPFDHLLAVDLLIAAIEDGRVDALPPDDILLIKPNRLATRLQSIAEAGPLHRAVVREFLDAGIDRVQARPGPLLVLFDELCAQTGTGPRAARAHLAALTHKAAKALVKRTGDPPEIEAQLALAARARRARRWMNA